MAVEDSRKLTIIRGKIYDISKFMDQHPGGRQLINLAVGRDATILFESSHIRSEIADARLKSLPEVTDLTVEDLANDAHGKFDFPPGDPLYKTSIKDGKEVRTVVDDFCSPGNSELYTVLKDRVRKEVLSKKGKKMGRGKVAVDAACVIAYYLLSVFLYNKYCTWWSALMLGAAAAWVGFGLQHTANHGGLTTNRFLNAMWGLGDDIACGASSLIWRYHHQVSHHVYTNTVDKDMDVYSSFPLMRFDDSQERQWFHKYQVYYAPFAFSLLYWSAQMQDFTCFLTEACYDIRLLGIQKSEKQLFWLGKFLHFFLVLFLPLYNFGTSMLGNYVLMATTGSFLLSWFFIVSHNILETKPSALSPAASKDWAHWQIETSATWGRAAASFFTGGLNYQIEHHLFPCIAHNHYKEIAPIVKEECAKRGIRYMDFPEVTGISIKMMEFMHAMGVVDSPAPIKMD